MARNISSLIAVLKDTASTLGKSEDYQWGHMGCCNCGFLAREITHLRKDQIHTYAMQRYGDWSEQLHDYCPTSGLPIDNLIAEMLDYGFDADDLRNLERLSDKRILDTFPPTERYLRFNVKSDVIKYLIAWAKLLEEDQCTAEISLTDLYVTQAEV